MLTVTDIPLNCLVPSPANVRRTGQSLRIEELAASIQNHGLLQNLTVRLAAPETRKAKKRLPYEVIAGGRRLAALKLLAKRKQVAANAPVACHILTDENATEFSLAENTLQCPMHPADQVEAFLALHSEQGLAVEDIAARFGITPAVVKQRLKLAAISPVLMQAYRDEKLSLDQLTAFAVTDDHGRQEQIWERCDGDEDRTDILAALNEEHIAADDRRAVLIGVDVYRAAGGAILRDLFDEESEGFFTDADLLNRLVEEKLEGIAEAIRAEGWKWVEAVPQFDYGAVAGMRRIYPKPKALSPDDQAKLDALEAAYEELTEDDEADIERLEAEIEALRGDDVFTPEAIAMAGVVVSLDYRGQPRIERGFVRREDDRRKADGKTHPAKTGPKPLSAALVAELTAYKTLALRESLGEQLEMALIAVTHALAVAAFFPHDGRLSCLAITARSVSLASRTPQIAESPTAQRIESCHAAWAARMPEAPEALWAFIAGLSEADRMALLAHCAALTIDAVRETETPEDEDNRHAETLADALSLDMQQHWQPTAAAYFSRVSKERILDAVREGVTRAAAENLATLKKAALAEAAEQRLAGKGWLPPILRTAPPCAAEPAA